VKNNFFIFILSIKNLNFCYFVERNSQIFKIENILRSLKREQAVTTCQPVPGGNVT